jgi:hypothetical protein
VEGAGGVKETSYCPFPVLLHPNCLLCSEKRGGFNKLEVGCGSRDSRLDNLKSR